ncbi:D-serine ammonia-lyase [Aequorivita sp. H23M31]|uniref:Probable D-serine dehydratase n=1 Tax=Aequorivita ciconiae TaxID=2494375 RepID=A0A410G6R4_9FLAO|nr:D-serine ammonia-lyase [Aequorivita sp. H23M31]QAA82988.1 D-serine ammonia-lyase [Aequorivita sp. H23M31]
MYTKDKIHSLINEVPLLEDIMNLKPVVWLNPNKKSEAEMPSFPIKGEEIFEAEKLWDRFAPFFVKVFPETQSSNGTIESPLKEISNMKSVLNQESPKIIGRMMLKCDNALPIAGSIKARGGFYEVLHYAEELALHSGILNKTDDYSIFASDKFKEFFSRYKIGVGSTGNLGLSIGIISASLGFQVTVYVSSDAKEWKKNLLRKKGATVIEFGGDFSEAILAGRQKTNADPMGYFVDDENSNELYLGYAVGALRLARQLKDQNISVDKDHPLFVYSPCGVGGSPGGTAFGLKHLFGDNVHCFFVEPTHSPAVLTALATGEMSNISVQDIGIDNKTEADGLAVGQASNFATNISNHLISGMYTIEDDHLFTLLAQLMDSENIFLEPSATAGLIGPQMIAQTDYAKKNHLNMKNATHIAWATGGDLVPKEERKRFYEQGKSELAL